MTEKVYHYPLWIRLWHVFNALLCLVLIVTGISMQFSEPNRSLVPFDLAVSIHNSAAILLIINYLYFLIVNRLSGNRMHYKITEKGYVKMLITQFRYYTLGIFRGEKTPFPVSEVRKFNPLQQFAYIVILYWFFPLIIITGLGLFFPEMIITRIFGISGLFLTDLFHILSGFVVSMFMIVHIYFCTMGTRLTSLFKGMINGWVEIH